jgi:hypothetical protein
VALGDAVDVAKTGTGGASDGAATGVVLGDGAGLTSITGATYGEGAGAAIDVEDGLGDGAI